MTRVQGKKEKLGYLFYLSQHHLVISILLLVVLSFFPSFEGYAFSSDATQSEPFARTVSTSLTHENGVWVSCPDSTDQKISDFLDANNIRKLDDYTSWLKHNLSYQRGSTPNRWKTPDQVLLEPVGDCKDYSVLNRAVLKVLGYEPVLLVIEAKNYSHAITVFKLNDQIVFFDNGNLITTQTHSLSELSSLLYRCTRFTKLFMSEGSTPAPNFVLFKYTALGLQRSFNISNAPSWK